MNIENHNLAVRSDELKNVKRPFQFSLQTFGIGVLAFAFLLGCIVRYGIPSTLVIVVHIAVGAFLLKRYTGNWATLDTVKRTASIVFLAICFGFMLLTFVGLWRFSNVVRETRVETMCSSPGRIKDVDVELFRGKMLFVSVNATVETEADLILLRNRILAQFDNEPDLNVEWNVFVESNEVFAKGLDDELFPSDSKSSRYEN